MFRVLALLMVAVLIAGVAACGGTAPTPTPPSAGGALQVEGAWARPALAGAGSAAYLTIRNGTAAGDVLVGVSTTVAREARVHETTTDASGMTGMHPVDSVAIAAGEELAFEPGGYHVMLSGLTKDIAAGDRFPLTLTFRQAGTLTVPVEVRAS